MPSPQGMVLLPLSFVAVAIGGAIKLSAIRASNLGPPNPRDWERPGDLISTTDWGVWCSLQVTSVCGHDAAASAGARHQSGDPRFTELQCSAQCQSYHCDSYYPATAVGLRMAGQQRGLLGWGPVILWYLCSVSWVCLTNPVWVYVWGWGVRGLCVPCMCQDCKLSNNLHMTWMLHCCLPSQTASSGTGNIRPAS